MTILRKLEESGALAGLSCEWLASSISPIFGHASTRRYFRVCSPRLGPPAVLVVYEGQGHDQVDRFVRTTAWLLEAGVPVPTILEVGRRAMLIEDLGDCHLQTILSSVAERKRCYLQATRVLSRIQRYGRRHPLPQPELEGLRYPRLRRELEFAEKHAFEGWLGLSCGAAMRHRGFDRLAEAVATLPLVACHRDYHARNLLVHDACVRVIDHQDLMVGPIFYDLASLLWDNYCDVPQAIVRDALRRNWRDSPCIEIPLSDFFPIPDFPLGLPGAARQAFCLVALQRSIKALGTFGYQVAVVGASEFARYVPRTWAHSVRAMRALGWNDLEAAFFGMEDALSLATSER